MISLKIVYAANILVAGWISISSLFFPKYAAISVFSGAYEYSEVIRLTGALWAAIFMISIIGMFLPQKMALILVFQLIYKGLWLVAVCIPAMIQNKLYPGGMAFFFMIWCVVLPFVIPWKQLFYV
ncbi:hypothetical protein ACJD0Z_02275 [Flavobacteriaceae bacterium M23B6Z8]